MLALSGQKKVSSTAFQASLLWPTSGLSYGSLSPDKCFIMSEPLSLFLQCQLAGNGFSCDHCSTLSSCQCLVLRSSLSVLLFLCPKYHSPISTACDAACRPPSSIPSGGCYSRVVSVKATSAPVARLIIGGFSQILAADIEREPRPPVRGEKRQLWVAQMGLERIRY